VNPETFSQAILSLRTYLQAGVSELAEEFLSTGAEAGNADEISDLLAELVILLSNYHEEGVQLFPVVYMTDDLNSILQRLDGKDPIAIGHGPRAASTIRRAFKQCAPLAEDREWAIFVECSGDVLRYGIFRADQSPLNPTTFERLRQCACPEVKLLGLTRLGNFIEIRSVTGKRKYIDLAGGTEGAKNPPKLVREFVEVASEDAPQNLRAPLQAFYYRLGIDILHSTHGTLVAVIREGEEIPSIFWDGTLLEPKIDLIGGILKHLDANDAESLRKLSDWSALLRKMTRMDGITVIDTAGAIVGYNCFIQNSVLEKLELQQKKGSDTIGGARRRAFEVLCAHVGEKLLGVLYKSQDGVVDFCSTHTRQGSL
jgi:NTP pyrophosphatase (non-canonical NTP hydrolase)